MELLIWAGVGLVAIAVIAVIGASVATLLGELAQMSSEDDHEYIDDWSK